MSANYQVHGKVDDPTENKIDHYAVSLRTDDEELTAISIKPFVDEDTPHRDYGIEIPIGVAEEVLDRYEICLLEVTR